MAFPHHSLGCALMGIAEHTVTGLRMGGMILFTWLAWRVLFESWEVTAQSESRRKNAWVAFRASILTMCFVMIFLASPENILRANGYISAQTGFWMMSGVTVGAILYAALIHHGMDVATGNRRLTWLACLLIAISSAAWGILGGSL